VLLCDRCGEEYAAFETRVSAYDCTVRSVPQMTSFHRLAGRSNALLKELRLAFARGELTEDSCCAVEGIRLIEEGIRSGLKLKALFVSKSGERRVQSLLPQIGSHTEILIVEDKLFASAVPTETPQGVAALVRCKTSTTGQVLTRASFGPLVAIAGIQDPGNLGTILRSAEAFNAAGVLLGENTASAFNAKVVRASAGSIFRIPIVPVKLADVLRQLRDRGLRLLATSSHKGTLLDRVDLRAPAAIFIGNEGAGLSRDLLAEMDEVIVIPHSPRVESLNAGIAAGIVLYEAARQRR